MIRESAASLLLASRTSSSISAACMIELRADCGTRTDPLPQLLQERDAAHCRDEGACRARAGSDRAEQCAPRRHWQAGCKAGCKRWRADASCGLDLTDPDRMWWKSSGHTRRLLIPIDALLQLRALAKRGTQIAERGPSEPGNQKRRLRGTPPISVEWGHATAVSTVLPWLFGGHQI